MILVRHRIAIRTIKKDLYGRGETLFTPKYSRHGNDRLEALNMAFPLKQALINNELSKQKLR